MSEHLAEAVGARLYTGPLFVKYNAVLRGLDSEERALREQMVRRCCDRAAADAYLSGEWSYERICAERLNTYATALHHGASHPFSTLLIPSHPFSNLLSPSSLLIPSHPFSACT